MELPSESRTDRARARSNWPIRKYRLGAEPGDSLLGSTTARERLEMMWELSCQAWSLSGRPVPDYPRHRTPGRIVRSPR